MRLVYPPVIVWLLLVGVGGVGAQTLTASIGSPGRLSGQEQAVPLSEEPRAPDAIRKKNRVDVSGIIGSSVIDDFVSKGGPEILDWTGGVEFSYARRVYVREETDTVIDVEIPVMIQAGGRWVPFSATLEDLLHPKIVEYNAVHLIPRLIVERAAGGTWGNLSLFGGGGAGVSRFSNGQHGEATAQVQFDVTVVVGASYWWSPGWAVRVSSSLMGPARPIARLNLGVAYAF